MERIGPLMAHLPVRFAQRARGLLAVSAAFLLPRDGAMQPLELLEAALQRLGVGNDGPIGERGEGLDAEVYPYDRASIGW